MTTLATKFNLPCNGCELDLIPYEHRDYMTCFHLVKRNANNFICVPIEIITLEMCESVIIHNNDLFKYIPDEFKTKEMCISVIKHDGNNLEFVPAKFKTIIICGLAYELDPTTIQFMPKEFISEDMYLAGVKRKADLIKITPDEYKTYNLCLNVISGTTLPLQEMINYIPEEHLDVGMYIEGLRNPKNWNEEALSLVPESIKGEMFYSVIANFSAFFLKYIPEEFYNPNVRVYELPDFLCQYDSIPELYKTPELVERYNKLTDTDSYDYWLAKLRSSMFCADVFKCVPEKFKTKELCEIFCNYR